MTTNFPDHAASNYSKEQVESALDFLIKRWEEREDCRFDAAYPIEFHAPSMDEEELEAASRSLLHNGIVVLRDFLTPERATRLADRVTGLVETLRPEIARGQSIDRDDLLIHNVTGRHLKTFPDFNEYGKPVINIRPKPDSGMMDIFHIDRLFPELPDFTSLRNDLVHGILDRLRTVRYSPINTNIYYNESVGATRGFHADSFTPQIKAMMYLTDALDASDGPHYYALGTHRDTVTRALNVDINRHLGNPMETDMPFFDKNRILPLLGRRGTVFISYQAGAHRGGPQAAGARRIVLMQNYMPS